MIPEFIRHYIPITKGFCVSNIYGPRIILSRRFRNKSALLAIGNAYTACLSRTRVLSVKRLKMYIFQFRM